MLYSIDLFLEFVRQASGKLPQMLVGGKKPQMNLIQGLSVLFLFINVNIILLFIYKDQSLEFTLPAKFQKLIRKSNF